MPGGAISVRPDSSAPVSRKPLFICEQWARNAKYRNHSERSIATRIGQEMESFAETISVLGAPMFMHSLGEDLSPSVVVARWRHSDAEIDIGAPGTVRVAINLQDGHHARHQIGSAALQAIPKVGSVSVLPADERVKVAIQGEADILAIFLRETFLATAVDGRFTCLALFNSHDGELRAAALQLLVAATRGEPDDSLLLETAIHRIANGLLDRDQRSYARASGGLARAARNRVDELIQASLEDSMAPPTLEQLASAACLSANHFIRAFRQQTGVTPHRHVVLRRLERALALLKTTHKSVAEVAEDIGFGTSAHFVATFRRTMGVTPGEFQAALR
jgi:AraC family transcriptional regulator